MIWIAIGLLMVAALAPLAIALDKRASARGERELALGLHRRTGPKAGLELVAPGAQRVGRDTHFGGNRLERTTTGNQQIDRIVTEAVVVRSEGLYRFIS